MDHPRIAKAIQAMTELRQNLAYACKLSYIYAMPNTATANSQITINGQPHAVGRDSFIGDIVAQLKLDPRKVAIELNRTIVPRSNYATTPVVPGDAIEIVGFIGGG